jgi:hypothetical protein
MPLFGSKDLVPSLAVPASPAHSVQTLVDLTRCCTHHDFLLRIWRRFSTKTLKAKAEKQAAWQEPWEHQLWDAVGPVSWHNLGNFSKGFSLSDRRFCMVLYGVVGFVNL